MTAPHPPAVASRFALNVGTPPPDRMLPDPYPFETVAPTREGFAQHDGTRIWWGVFGDTGP